MNGNHTIYLQWKDTIKYTYNVWLQQHLITMDGYQINPTYNERLPQHLLTMNGYHNIYLQWTVTMASIYNGRLS
jgi:hypothetical protein